MEPGKLMVRRAGADVLRRNFGSLTSVSFDSDKGIFKICVGSNVSS